MAGNSVVLTFLGEDGPLHRTIKRVEGDADRLGSALGGLGKLMLGIGATGSAVQGIAALGTSLAQMSGAALLAPAGLLAAGAAFATGKLAAQGFGDAVKGDAEALAKLAPSARDTVNALTGMKTEWQAVQQTVQQNVFAGVSGDVKQLGASYLPVLKTGLGGIATGFNQIARNALGALKTPQAIGAVKGVLDATGSSLMHMQESLGNLISGFLNLAGAGAKFLAGAGGGFTSLTERFDAWTQRITTDGSFEKWVTTAGAAFRDLFAVIGNVGSIVTTVITGLAGPTQGLFTSLAQVTGQIRAFLESAQGQDALAALGETLRTISAVVRDVLGAALQQIGPIVQAMAPALSQLAQALGPMLIGAIQIVGPMLTGLFSFLSQQPGLVLGLVGAMAGLWAAFQVGAAVVGVVRAATLAWQGAQLLVQGATAAWTGVQWLLNAALSANPIGIVIVVIAALVAAIIYAWNNSETFRSIVLAVWAAVQSAITTAVNVIKSVIAWFGSLPGLIGGWFGRAKDAAVNAFTAMVAWVRGLPGRILSALGNLGSLLVSVGRDIINGLWNGISAGWSWLTGKVSDLASSLLGAAKSALGIASPSKLFRDEVGKWIPEGMAVGIIANARVVTDAVDGLGEASIDSGVAQASRAVSVAMSPAPGPMNARGGGQVQVSFTGNTSDAFATAIMKLFREGKIQVTR